MTSLPQVFVPLVLATTFLIPGSLVQAAGLAQHYQINEGGQSRIFVIATDELHTVGKRHPDKIPPAANAEAVRRQAEGLSRALGQEVRLVLYPQGSPRTQFTRRILTREVLLHLEAGVDVQALAQASGAKVSGAFDYLPGHYLLAASEAGGALAIAEALRGKLGVISAEPQLARLVQKKAVPNDSFFANQWHLLNTGQNGATPGIDINVTNVWNSFRGTNIYIAIVDDGLQFNHPDLSPNALSATNLDYDFNGHDWNPSPDPANGDFHGTAVAGVAAARGDNGVGVCGAAYEAKLVGLRLIALPSSDADDAAAMLTNNSVIQIKNSSWGAPDCQDPNVDPPPVLLGPGPLMEAARAQGVATGRNGRGEIYTWAGGNGLGCQENVNYDGYANSINVFAVAALGDDGNQAFYSEPGACLVITAPSSDDFQGITTTDLTGADGYNANGAADLADNNYTKTFGGTSAAAPLAAGVIALVLQANPDLSYRDVKEILLRSATKVQPADPDWATNSAGIAHNHKFGGGLINAQAAVHLATNWVYLGPLTNMSLLQTNLNLLIPDNNPNGVTRLFTFTNKFRVEHMTLTLTATDAYWGDLAVTVTAPSGMQSRLAEQNYPVDPSYSYQAWTFSSVRHWGEDANGTWTVKVADLGPGITGHLQALELKVYGTPKATLTLARTNQSIRLNLQAAAPGWSYAVESSTNMTSWAQLTTLTMPATGKTNYTDTNALSLKRRFYRARLLP